MTENREQQKALRADFLQTAGWGDATSAALAGDASTRSYERLSRNGQSAVLMIAPPGAEAKDCPPEASTDERRALGYNAMARLAGPNLNAFVAIARKLNSVGLSAPEVFAADPKTGFALIEDLGDDLFVRAVVNQDEGALYRAAIDALLELRKQNPQPPKGADYTMLNYDQTALEAEVELLTEWYWPHKNGVAASKDILEEYQSLWRGIIAQLSPPHSFVLRDYHAENLLWLPQRESVKRVGIIDFQDALYGAAAYDLVSLVEDARRDVAPDLAAALKTYYEENAGKLGNFDAVAFDRDFAILAAQRNAKILGIFARLINRDSKPRYKDFLPRVEAHFRRDLERPAMAPVKNFFAKHFKGTFS